MDRIDWVDQALEIDGVEGLDYILRPGQMSCWITVDGLSIFIARAGSITVGDAPENRAVKIEVFAKGREGEDPIGDTWVFEGNIPSLGPSTPETENTDAIC